MQNDAGISCAEVLHFFLFFFFFLFLFLLTTSQLAPRSGSRFVHLRDGAREEYSFFPFVAWKVKLSRGHCTRNLLLHVTRVTVSPGKPLYRKPALPSLLVSLLSFVRLFFSINLKKKKREKETEKILEKEKISMER